MVHLACPTHSLLMTSIDDGAVHVLLATKLPHTPSGKPNEANSTLSITPPLRSHDSDTFQLTAVLPH